MIVSNASAVRLQLFEITSGDFERNAMSFRALYLMGSVPEMTACKVAWCSRWSFRDFVAVPADGTVPDVSSDISFSSGVGAVVVGVRRVCRLRMRLVLSCLGSNRFTRGCARPKDYRTLNTVRGLHPLCCSESCPLIQWSNQGDLRSLHRTCAVAPPSVSPFLHLVRGMKSRQCGPKGEHSIRQE